MLALHTPDTSTTSSAAAAAIGRVDGQICSAQLLLELGVVCGTGTRDVAAVNGGGERGK